MESEGIKESAINVAFGRKQSNILASEAVKIERINKAAGQAEADILIAQAKSRALGLIAEALSKNFGNSAASLLVAQQYISAFTELAKQTNAIILPSDIGNIPSMVAQAMTMYTTLSKVNYSNSPVPTDTPPKDSIPNQPGAGNNATNKYRDTVLTKQTSSSHTESRVPNMSVFESPTRIY